MSRCRTRAASAGPTARCCSGGSEGGAPAVRSMSKGLRDIRFSGLRIERLGSSLMLVTRTLPPDTDLLALHRQSPARYPLLLESAGHGTAQGRWDMLLAANGHSLALHAAGVVRDAAGVEIAGDFLSAPHHHWQDRKSVVEGTGVSVRVDL